MITFLIVVIINLYFIDRVYLLCPIEYKNGIIIRSDEKGSGYFAALRKGNRRHKGIDLYAQIGTEVKAVRFARVAQVGFHKNLGNYVELDHWGDIVTIYGHLYQTTVNSGQWVRQGQIIGYVGKSGNAAHPKICPHLHFEIRRNNTPIDPQEWLEEK